MPEVTPRRAADTVTRPAHRARATLPASSPRSAASLPRYLISCGLVCQQPCKQTCNDIFVSRTPRHC